MKPKGETLERKRVLPRFFPDDSVVVRNYRRHFAQWEDGTVLRTETSWRTKGSFRHSYEVRLDRVGPTGLSIRVAVGDDGIRPRRAS